MKLSIVIVNYKAKEYLAECLASIKKYPTRHAHEVIVIDNNSQDGSVDYVKEMHQDVILLINNENVGFARANNRAILGAAGEYILLLNPDAQVTEGALDSMITVADNTDHLGTLGGSLIYPDGRAQSSSYKFPGLWAEIRKLFFLEKPNESRARSSARARVDWSCGAALMFKKTIDGITTQLDPAIFMYSEDLELCWRLSKEGKLNYVTGAAQFVHAHNKSGEQKYGPGRANKKRLLEFRRTLQYVTSLYWPSPLQPARFTVFRYLIALNDYWRILLLKTIFRNKYVDQERQDRIAEHRSTARVFLSPQVAPK